MLNQVLAMSPVNVLKERGFKAGFVNLKCSSKMTSASLEEIKLLFQNISGYLYVCVHDYLPFQMYQLYCFLYNIHSKLPYFLVN